MSIMCELYMFKCNKDYCETLSAKLFERERDQQSQPLWKESIKRNIFRNRGMNVERKGNQFYLLPYLKEMALMHFCFLTKSISSYYSTILMGGEVIR